MRPPRDRGDLADLRLGLVLIERDPRCQVVHAALELFEEVGQLLADVMRRDAFDTAHPNPHVLEERVVAAAIRAQQRLVDHVAQTGETALVPLGDQGGIERPSGQCMTDELLEDTPPVCRAAADVGRAGLAVVPEIAWLGTPAHRRRERVDLGLLLGSEGRTV